MAIMATALMRHEHGSQWICKVDMHDKPLAGMSEVVNSHDGHGDYTKASRGIVVEERMCSSHIVAVVEFLRAVSAN